MATIGDYLRVVASMYLDIGVTVQNVFFLRVQGPTNPGDDDVLDDCGEYLEAIYTEILTELPDSMDFTEYSVQNVTADVSIGTAAWPSLTTGSNVSDTLPSGDAGLLLARTSTPGHHGRKFFGPMSEASVDGGLPNSTALAALTAAGQEAYTDPFTSTNSFTYNPVIYDDVAATGRTVREWQADADIAYQRRRRPGRGI